MTFGLSNFYPFIIEKNDLWAKLKVRSLGSTVLACNDRSWWLFYGQQSWDEMAHDSIPAPDKLLVRKSAHEKFLCAFLKRTYE